MSLEELLAKLISFKTITGNHKEVKEAYKFIKSYLGKDFYYKDICYNDFHSLLISNTKSMTDFDILFNGHIDVVQASDSDFVARIEDDKMYGRGTIDMKGQIATILHTLKNTNSTKHLGLLLTSDEEIGGHNGAEPICIHENLSAKIVIIPDAGENFTFVDSEKALLQLDLVTTGTPAHASVPHLGKNAIIEACNAYNELCEAYNIDPNTPINDEISINFSKIESGDLYNKVPGIANWALDIRHSHIKRKDIEKILSTICKKHNTIYSIHNYADEYRCDLKNPEIVNFIKVCENHLGRKLEHINENGASDIGYFCKIKLPAVSINPEGYNLHSDNEYIIISSLYKYKDMIVAYINN